MIPKVKELTRGEEKDLLKNGTDERTLSGKRAAAVLATLLRTGIRRGELCRLLVEDFTDGPLASLRVKTLKQRNGKEPYRSIPLGPETASLISKYLKARNGHGTDPDSPLFLTLRSYGGKPKAITHTALHRLLLKALAKAKISRRVRLHSFRHHFANRVHQHAPVATVKTLLGHSKIETTATYLSTSEPKMRQTVTAAFEGR